MSTTQLERLFIDGGRVMRGSFFLSLVITVLMVQGANAQVGPAPASVSSKSAKKSARHSTKAKSGKTVRGASKRAAITPEDSAASANSSSMKASNSNAGSVHSQSSGMQTLSAEGTSTAKVAAPVRRIFADLWSYNAVQANDFNNGRQGKLEGSDNFFGLRYKISDHQSVAVRQQFTFKYSYGETGSKNAQEAQGHLSDTYIRYTDSKLIPFANDGNVALRAQVYLPTGEDARFYTKHMGIYVGRLMAVKPLNKTFTLDVAYQATAYAQTLTNYIGDDGKEAATKRYSGLAFAELDVDFGHNLSWYQLVGIKDVYTNALTDGSHKNDRSFVSDMAFGYTPVPGTTLYLGIGQGTSIANGKSVQWWGDAQGTEYYFALEAAL